MFLLNSGGLRHRQKLCRASGTENSATSKLTRRVTIKSPERAKSHGYAARESNMHVIAEMVNWLDKYVKNAGSTTTTR